MSVPGEQSVTVGTTPKLGPALLELVGSTRWCDTTRRLLHVYVAAAIQGKGLSWLEVRAAQMYLAFFLTLQYTVCPRCEASQLPHRSCATVC